VFPGLHPTSRSRRGHLVVSRQGSDMFLEKWTSRLGAIAGVSHLPCMMAASKRCGILALRCPQDVRISSSPTTREHWG
jgi:hypothetical protein